MKEAIDNEHQFLLDTVSDYAVAMASNRIPREFGLQELSEIANCVDYQARIIIEVLPGGEIVSLDVFLRDPEPGVFWVERDAC